MTTSPTPFTPAQIWLMAARPKTLPAAAAPVIVGSAAAWGAGRFEPLPALAALMGALLIQIGTNLANDVFDYQKGADTAERLGPLRVTQAGLLSPRQVMVGMVATFALAATVGLYLIAVGGWPIVVIGLLSILCGIAYTGGPFPLGYNGLGDIFVFIFFGPVAVCGTYYVQAQTITPTVMAASLPIGLLATAILVVNNLRDIETDRKVGKKTLAVRFGERGAQGEYLALLALTYLIPVGMSLFGLAHWPVLLTWLSIPVALPQIRRIMTEKGRPLNLALAGTAQLELVYSLFFALGLGL